MSAQERSEFAAMGGRARVASMTEREHSELGTKAGKVGGKARAEKLSAKRRREIAKAAAAARWRKSH